MTWLDAVVSAVAVALLVRVDAVAIGPYWALVELIQTEEPRPRIRRHTIRRRFLYPALVGAALVTARPDASLLDGAIVGALGAGLLLWPMVFHGMPLWLVRHRSILIGLYVAFVVGFFASGYTGALIAEFLADVIAAGTLGEFIGAQVVWLVLAVVLQIASATVQERTAIKVERESLQGEE